MRSASERFALAVSGSHQIATRVDVLYGRQVILEGLPGVTSASLTIDRTAARLTRATVVVAGSRVPLSISDNIAPTGYELRLWRGVTFSDGTTEMVPLGTLPIQSSPYDETTGLSTVECVDRSQLVSDSAFEDTYVIDGGADVFPAIEAMISDGVEGLEFLLPSTTFYTPQVIYSGSDDRWEKAQLLAGSLGYELYFDGLGRVTARAEPTFSGESVLTVTEGETLLSVVPTPDRSTTVNKVIMTGSSSALDDNPRAVAVDDDPSSLTFYDGPFERKSENIFSNLVTTDEQAAAAAEAYLAARLGIVSSVSVSMVPDPRLEPSDVIRLVRTRSGLDELHIIDKISMGLASTDGMSFTTRGRRVT